MGTASFSEWYLDAEIIHVVGFFWSDSLEDRIGLPTQEAGLAMLNDGQRHYAESHGIRLLPVLRHLGNVQLTGIARLRYRAPYRQTTGRCG